MSSLRSSHRDRNKIHAELTALLATGGPLAEQPERVGDFLSDELVAEVAMEYRARESNAPSEGRAAVVTAGPPGAGKSTAVADLAGDHRVIDPDAIKGLLLARLEAAGELGIRHRFLLADGKPVAPAEISWWVHRASTDAADAVRTESLRIGENFVMEGTLSWVELPAVYARELGEFEYESVVILDVEVSRSTAVEQAKKRWWDGRCDGSTLGGRFMQDSVFASYYPEGDRASIGVERAWDLYDRAIDMGVHTSLASISRDTDGSPLVAVVTPEGLKGWPARGVYAGAGVAVPCRRCGRPLRSLDSIAIGLGPSCRAQV